MARRSAAQTAPRAGLREPGSRPYPRLAVGTDTIPQVKHIVVLMMENHSYDNHLGMLRRAESCISVVDKTIGCGRPAPKRPQLMES